MAGAIQLGQRGAVEAFNTVVEQRPGVAFEFVVVFIRHSGLPARRAKYALHASNVS